MELFKLRTHAHTQALGGFTGVTLSADEFGKS